MLGARDRTSNLRTKEPSTPAAVQSGFNATGLLSRFFLAVLAFSLFIFRIGTPPWYIYDEVYHAQPAAEYLAGNADAYVWYARSPITSHAYTWNHPPLGLLLIAGSIKLWGHLAPRPPLP